MLQWAGAAVVGGFGLLFAAAMAVLFTRWFLSLEFMQDFLVAYPGEYHLPEGAPVGMPPWLGWQHFFNVFLHRPDHPQRAHGPATRSGRASSGRRRATAAAR